MLTSRGLRVGQPGHGCTEHRLLSRETAGVAVPGGAALVLLGPRKETSPASHFPTVP